jgi:hypothetical protein
LTTLVGFPGDEGVGNDSYIGALATVDRDDSRLWKNNYYVVTPHVVDAGAPARIAISRARSAGVTDEPVRFDIQSQIATLLTQRWKTLVHSNMQGPREATVPAFTIQPFTVSDGSVRYYVRAQFGSEPEIPTHAPTPYAMGAWITPTPRLRILAVERQANFDAFEYALPILRNVVDLGDGRTGLIVTLTGPDSTYLALREYQDGVPVPRARTLQIIGAGE